MQEEKVITVYVDGVPKFKITVIRNTQIGQIKKLLGEYIEAKMEVYKGKELPVFQTNKYDKVNLSGVFNKMKDSKIFLKSKPKNIKNVKNVKVAKTAVAQSTKGFPTGLKDVDLYFLSSLDDRSLLNALNTNKATREYRNNEDMWRNRFRHLNPEVEFTPKGLWRDFSLSLIKYMALAENDYNKALRLAARDGNADVVKFFAFKTNNWNYGLFGAIEGGHRNWIDYFISKGADDWNEALKLAAIRGDFDLVKFFLEKEGDVYTGVYGAALGGHRELVDYLLPRVASPSEAIDGAAEGGHSDLLNYLISLYDEDEKYIGYAHGAYGAARGGRIDLLKFFLTRINRYDLKEVLERCLFIAAESGKYDMVKFLLQKGAKKVNIALYRAALKKNREIVNLLLDKGADLDEALEVATDGGHVELVEYLQSIKASK